MQETLRKENSGIHLRVASDGAEAMQFLKRQELQGGDRTRPDLIVLDLNLPNGERTNADESLKVIPTIILAGSSTETDIANSSELQGNSSPKPVKLRPFSALIKSIENYRLKKSQLHGRKSNET
jgi:DNA-binding response OmpR family regulator